MSSIRCQPEWVQPLAGALAGGAEGLTTVEAGAALMRVASLRARVGTLADSLASPGDVVDRLAELDRLELLYCRELSTDAEKLGGRAWELFRDGVESSDEDQEERQPRQTDSEAKNRWWDRCEILAEKLMSQGPSSEAHFLIWDTGNDAARVREISEGFARARDDASRDSRLGDLYALMIHLLRMRTRRLLPELLLARKRLDPGWPDGTSEQLIFFAREDLLVRLRRNSE